MLQVFLDKGTGGVSEVSYRQAPPPQVCCTCPEFKPHAPCMHALMVHARLTRLRGNYPFPRIDPAELAAANGGSAADFRHFILTHGVVELI